MTKNVNFNFHFHAPVGQNIAHVDKLEAHFDKDMTMQVVSTDGLMNHLDTVEKEEKTVSRRAECSFRNIVQHKEPEVLLKRLHQLIDGRSGASVGSVLLKCCQDGHLIRRPTQREFESEFALIGGWTAVHKYMDDNNENALDRANQIIIF